MPQINLSTLSGPELRQVLDSSRRQGDAALSYRVLQEMAARREAPPDRKSRGRRRPAEPRGFVVDLEEAAADDLPPMPYWVAPARELEHPEAAPPAPAPEPPVAAPRRGTRRKASLARAPVAEITDAFHDDPPASLVAPDPEPAMETTVMSDDDLRLAARDPEPPRAARQARPPRTSRGRGRMALGFLLGGALGVGLGWWGGGVYREIAGPGPAPTRTAALSLDTSPPPPAAAPSAPIETASSTSPVEGAVSPAAEGAPSPPPAPASNQTPVEPPEPSAPPLRTADATPKEDPARPASERATQVASGGASCESEPTPADRTICGDPELRRLQRDLQRAYAQALAAHEDRTLLRERQLAWRDARNAVADPERLTQLYQDRIRRLNAATAEARRLKDGA